MWSVILDISHLLETTALIVFGSALLGLPHPGDISPGGHRGYNPFVMNKETPVTPLTMLSSSQMSLA